MMQVLAIGDATRSEFSKVLDSLQRLTDLRLIDDVPETPDADVDLVMFLQSYTKQFSAAAVDRLRRWLPLTPMVVVLGAWCAGELRTGSPLVGPFRVYADEWDETELLRLRDGHDSLWTQPSTLGDDEAILFQNRLQE
jgi:hypothetical protein